MSKYRCTCGAPPDSIHEPICDLMQPMTTPDEPVAGGAERWEAFGGGGTPAVVTNGLPTPDPRWRIVAQCKLRVDADRIAADHNASLRPSPTPDTQGLLEAREQIEGYEAALWKLVRNRVQRMADDSLICLTCLMRTYPEKDNDAQHEPDCPVAIAGAVLSDWDALDAAAESGRAER